MSIRLIRAMFLALVVLLFSSASFAQLRITVGFGPPALPVYDQPVCPGDGFIWAPGYWAWDGDDYYWVPGTWIEAPEVGYLWTPPWWGWDGGVFLFHEGFWGPHVGFYGGINYGFGYFGDGFVGGRWDGGHFFYNRSVMNVNVVNVHNVYNETVVNRNVTVNHISYNGGQGGIEARPTAQDEQAEHDRHIGPVAAQNNHVETARNNPELKASRNAGRPPVAATARASAFSGNGVVAAKEAGGAYHPPANRGATANENRGGTANENRGEPARETNNSNVVHAKDLPPMEKPPAPNTGNAKLDQKYQQQQQKLASQQDKQRQKLAQQQEKEDQQMAQRNASQAAKQQTEQRHQQQTQQLRQNHVQQQQRMVQRQSPPPSHGGEKPK